MRIRLNKRTIIDFFFIILLFQQSLLIHSTGVLNTILQYCDEVLSVLFFIFIFCAFAKKSVRIHVWEKRMLIFYCGFVLCGLISNVFFPMQGVLLNLSDALVCSRFILFYFFARLFLKENSIKILKSIDRICKIFLVITFFIAVHDMLFTPFFGKADFRYFMYSLRLYFPHPTYMAVGCATGLLVVIAAMGITKKRKKSDILYVLLGCFLLLSTMRAKAMASMAIILVLFFVIIILRLKSKILLGGLSAVFAGLIGWQQFKYYYMGSNVEKIARARLHMDAIKLANQRFPLGTGFATFGSNIAAKQYSPIYTMLGYSRIQGLSKMSNGFLSDTFWPIVIAQTGWIGFGCFLGVIFCFIAIAIKMEKKNIYFYLVMISIMVYEIISSTSESAFFNPPVCLLFALFGLLMNIAEEKTT